MTGVNITINGVRLTDGQSISLRVAVLTFMLDLNDPDSLGEDPHGRLMTSGYKERLSEILGLLGTGGNQPCQAE